MSNNFMNKNGEILKLNKHDIQNVLDVSPKQSNVNSILGDQNNAENLKNSDGKDSKANTKISGADSEFYQQ